MTCHSQMQKKFKNKTKQHWKVRKSANSNLWFTCDIKGALFWQALSSHQASSILTSSKHCLDIKKALSWHQANTVLTSSIVLTSSKHCPDIKRALFWCQASSVLRAIVLICWVFTMHALCLKGFHLRIILQSVKIWKKDQKLHESD